MKTYDSFSVRDSGAPPGRYPYTTLILLHGMGWHSAVFDKLFPLAASRNVRLVTPNRPGYPGAAPFPADEQARLNGIAEAVDQDRRSAADAFLDYIKEDTKKTHAFLINFISTENIPLDGGIVLAGWSLSAITILGLLAYAGAIPTKELEINLRPYIKQLIIYDAPSCVMGYAPPPSVHAPLFDPSLTPGEVLKIFPGWVSGYYAHGEDLGDLEFKALDYPAPTISSMDRSDVQRCLEVNPVLPGGPDDQFIRLGVQLGVFSRLRDCAMFPGKNEWDNVKVKYVWCDHSPWEIPWGVRCLQADLQGSGQSGRNVRKIELVRVRGGNHFCHWDKPDLALEGLLTGL